MMPLIRECPLLAEADARSASNRVTARLGRQVGKEAAPQSGEAEPIQIRFSAKSVIALRSGLGISAADFGKLVGVTGHTIYKWEHGTSRPQKAQLVVFAAIRGLGKKGAHARLEQLRAKTPKKRAPKR